MLVGREVVEAAAEAFVKRRSKELSRQCSQTMTASWHYHTNLTSHNKAVLVSVQYIKFMIYSFKVKFVSPNSDVLKEIWIVWKKEKLVYFTQY